MRIRGRGVLVVAGGRAVISIIEGDGDAGVYDDEVGDAVVAGGWDSPLDVKDGWNTKLISESSNGHQSNAVSEAPEVLDCPNKKVIVSCLATPGAIATTHPTQVKIRRAALPKYIAYGPWYDDKIGLEDP